MRRLAIALAVLVLFAAGCGSGSEGGGDQSSAPEAKQPLRAAIAHLNNVIRKQDCDGLVALTFSAMRVNAAGDGPAEAGERVRPGECQENGADELLQVLHGVRFTHSEDYGAGAISEGPAGGSVAGYRRFATVLLADRDGRWRHVVFFPADEQFATDMAAAADPVGVTKRFVRLIKTGDCGEAAAVIAADTRFGENPRESCQTLKKGDILAPALRDAQEIDVETIGSSRDYAITGINTGSTYFGVVLATPPIKSGRPPQHRVFVAEVVPLTDFKTVDSSPSEAGQ
jgi:hypothetical protein